MKNKKILPVALCAILLAGILWSVMGIAPTVNHALRISELLQPVLEAKNQTMHIDVVAQLGNDPLTWESDVYQVTEDGISYLAIGQNKTAVYIANNVLFLENGKAFKIGDKLQKQTASYAELLPYIKTLYETLKITAQETENETSYSITVTGEQISPLLAAASFGEALPVEGIEQLHVCLTERSEKLETITFSGNGALNGTSVTLNVTLSGFRMLSPGDYPIPDGVKQCAATVDPEELFSLSEDLYRLVVALTPFAHMASIDGTLALTVDCGLIQLDTAMKLSDLSTASDSQIDPETLQALPEVLGWLCMEGDIRCTQNGTSYVYTLKLDHDGMQALSRMILPELSRYSGDLTEGSISIHLEDRMVTSMGVSIRGKIHALIVQVPIKVEAVFTFA